MEKIARGCFISPQPCLCTRSTLIFSSLSLNQSSLLFIAPPPPPSSLSSFNFPHFLSSLYQILRTFFSPHPPPPVRQKCQDGLFAHPPPPPPPPPRALCQRPQEDEAALSLWTGFEGRRGRKSSREREREAVEERGTEEVTSPFFGEVCEVRKLQ